VPHAPFRFLPCDIEMLKIFDLEEYAVSGNRLTSIAYLCQNQSVALPPVSSINHGGGVAQIDQNEAASIAVVPDKVTPVKPVLGFLESRPVL
jgi:hypothetical protein